MQNITGPTRRDDRCVLLFALRNPADGTMTEQEVVLDPVFCPTPPASTSPAPTSEPLPPGQSRR